jgi:hypothetical protein
MNPFHSQRNDKRTQKFRQEQQDQPQQGLSAQPKATILQVTLQN